MPPTIRATLDASGNITAIETFQGPRGWVQILSEPIQRGDVLDLIAAIAPGAAKSVTAAEARRLVDDALQSAWVLGRPPGLTSGEREIARERATAARTALLRALGVEA